MLLGVTLLTIMIQSESKEASDTNSVCTSLMIYDASGPLARYREATKTVTVGEHTVTLHQNWAQNGVAGVVWDSAIVLSRYLLENNLLRNQRIIELGAGIGLPSIISIKEGAKQVTITDLPSALPLLEQNVRENTNYTTGTRFVALDWENDVHEDNYDIILGADLVYLKEVFEALRKTLQRLCKEHTVIYMASKIRYRKDKQFYSSLKENGVFDVKQVLYDTTTDVRVYKITKS